MESYPIIIIIAFYSHFQYSAINIFTALVMDAASSLLLLFSTKELVDVGVLDFTFVCIVLTTIELPQQGPHVDVTEKQSLPQNFHGS